MSVFTTKEAYIHGFQIALENTNRETKDLEDYLTSLIQRLDTLLDQVSKESFWQLMPAILGIDAKLSLLMDLLDFEDFSNKEIIQMTENDYLTYFKELCGYKKSAETKHSMIFNLI